MSSLFEHFVRVVTNEGVEVDKISGASALIKSSVQNVEEGAIRQVHSQCTHTNFKDCSKRPDSETDEKLLKVLAESRAAARLGSGG